MSVKKSKRMSVKKSKVMSIKKSKRTSVKKPKRTSVKKSKVMSVKKPKVISVKKPKRMSVKKPKVISVKKSKRMSVKKSIVNQKGGFNLSLISSVGKSLLSNPIVKNITKDIAHQVVDLTSQHVLNKYGVKVDTKDLHQLVNSHPNLK